MIKSACAESCHTTLKNRWGNRWGSHLNNINMVNICSIYNILFNLYISIIEYIPYSGLIYLKFKIGYSNIDYNILDLTDLPSNFDINVFNFIY
jgi:hypothetical protein